MARLQILYLPSVERDGVRDQPFALIVDGMWSPQRIIHGLPRAGAPPTCSPPCTLPQGHLAECDANTPTQPVEAGSAWQEFAVAVGARAVIVTPDRVDIADGSDDDTVGVTVQFDTDDVVREVVDVLRARVERLAAEAAGLARRDVLNLAGQ